MRGFLVGTGVTVGADVTVVSAVLGTCVGVGVGLGDVSMETRRGLSSAVGSFELGGCPQATITSKSANGFM